MRTKKKSPAMKFLEGIIGGPLTLGALLSAIREGEEETQTEFAAKLGVSKSHLCDIEKGRKTVSPARAAKFARTLGYSQEQFVRLSLQALVEEAGLEMTVHLDA
ncbi:MAG: helix-turn-helix transcriptional regulator [Deltaproteobacteria bacterium]|nr:helix-turn-helix transcriptional regulator [Deltaproteobacteria bacterium]